ncbi:MAG TPA: hypothetical protein VF066_06050 [Thermoleophilaceae bacterium]
MELGEERAALQAKTELAMRHAAKLREQAIEQRARAVEQRTEELRATAAAKRAERLEGRFLECKHCNAIWRTEDVRATMRRRAGCLLCGRSLTPVP